MILSLLNRLWKLEVASATYDNLQLILCTSHDYSLVLFFPFSESTIFLSCFSPLCLFLQLIYWLSIKCHRLNSHTSGIYWASDRFGRFIFFFHSSLSSLFFLFLSFPSPHFTRLRSNFSIYLWVRYEIGEYKSYNVCGSRLFFCIEFVGYTVCVSRLYIFLNLSTLVRDFVSHNCILFEFVDDNSRARWYDIQLVFQKKMKVRYLLKAKRFRKL